MSRQTTLRRELVARLLAEVERRGLDPDALAKRTGYDKKTIGRILKGETCNLETLERVEAVLRVDLLDCSCPEQEQDGAEGCSMVQPVSGWIQAALVLRLSRWTMRRWRAKLGLDDVLPWWPSERALLAWWEKLTVGRVATVASSTALPPRDASSDAPRHPQRQRRANAGDRSTR